MSQNKDLAFGQEDGIERGDSGTPVVERTSPKKQVVDTVRVKEIKKMLEKSSAEATEFTPEQTEQILNLLEVLLNNTETNTLEVGGDLEVDGDIKSDNEELYIYGGVDEQGQVDVNKVVISKNPPGYPCSCILIDSDGVIFFGFFTNDDFDWDKSVILDTYEGIIRIKDSSKLQDHEGNLILKDLEDAVNGENTVTITFTEDDWDEDDQSYIKRVELNNCFISVTNNTESEHEGVFKIYCPYFKGITIGSDPNVVDSFAGSVYEPEDRRIELLETCSLSVFNGLVTQIYIDL